MERVAATSDNGDNQRTHQRIETCRNGGNGLLGLIPSASDCRSTDKKICAQVGDQNSYTELPIENQIPQKCFGVAKLLRACEILKWDCYVGE